MIGNVFRNNGARGDNCALADRNPLQNNASCADPSILLDENGSGNELPSLQNVMIMVINATVGTNGNATFQGNTLPGYDGTIAIYENLVTQRKRSIFAARQQRTAFQSDAISNVNPCTAIHLEIRISSKHKETGLFAFSKKHEP
jgi:hypothetical protein